MRLLSSLIYEEEGLSLNDLTMLQRLMLKKAYTGRLDPFEQDLTEPQLAVLDTLVDLGLLDGTYEVTDSGEKAAKMLDSYSKQEREDISIAKDIAAAEIRGQNFDDEDYSDELEDFPFTEGEIIALRAAGLSAIEVAKILVKEGGEYKGHPSYSHHNALKWVSLSESIRKLANGDSREAFVRVMNEWETPDGVVLDTDLAGYAWDKVNTEDYMKLDDLFLFEDMHMDLDTSKFNPDGGAVQKVYTWAEFKDALPQETNGVEHKPSKSGGTVSVAYIKNEKIDRFKIVGVFKHKEGYGEVMV